MEYKREKKQNRKNCLKEISGTTGIVVAAPCAGNGSDMAPVNARHFTGAMARLLADETGCGSLFARKRIREDVRVQMKEEFMGRMKEQEVNLIVELCASPFKKSMIRLGESGYIQGEQLSFFERLAKYVIEYEYRDLKKAVPVELFNYAQGTVLSKVSQKLKKPLLVIEINENLFKPEDTKAFERMYRTLKKMIVLLSNLDWKSDKCDVYRVWQTDANSQIPQDKIAFADGKASFSENSFLHISSFEGMQETVRVNKISDSTKNELKKYFTQHGSVGKFNEYVILTNRLIENLFGREWFEGEEEHPGLRGAPVIVYENTSERYEIGIPKADQLDSIWLSTGLYDEKRKLSDKYDFLLFNRYSDSRIYIEMEDADYGDKGRVKSGDGRLRAQKVMMPRYYRLMMGYLEKPLKTIRAEEYWKIISDIMKIRETMENSVDAQKDGITKEDFDRCYRKVSQQAYFQLIEEDEKPDDDKDRQLYEASREKIVRYLEKIGAYDQVDLIRVPKRIKPEKKIHEKFFDFVKRSWMWVLEKTIGKVECRLKTTWAGNSDDKNSVARLNSNMMSLIGVSENDKICIRFGDSSITLRVLPEDDLSDYEIGIPSSGRRLLGMNSMNDIVVVNRDMSHIFKRHSQIQTIAILGTVLAVIQVLDSFVFFQEGKGVVLAVIVCILMVIFMLYFALNEERVKVK